MCRPQGKATRGNRSQGFIVTAELTNSDVAAATAFPQLLRKVQGRVKTVTTDGSYDRRHVWKVIDDLGAHAVIPLRRGAMLKEEEVAKVRNRYLRRIRKVGRAQWRRDSGQHKQAKVDNAIGRFKRILGPSLRARCPDGQQARGDDGVCDLEPHVGAWRAPVGCDPEMTGGSAQADLGSTRFMHQRRTRT